MRRPSSRSSAISGPVIRSAASVYWTSATGAHEVQGEIRKKWAATGAHSVGGTIRDTWAKRSRPGYPVSGEYGITGGRRSDFQQRGYLARPSATGDTQVVCY
ncbi:hypothetical protein [Amycolatopsis sp.]|uniref:LGFP repeat-containing protein n=1 Tax=Amycolatopsis sp. TaxID=37632 RepID=UPI002C19D8AA|nr:hypothetical protein [Amycolatopsis sp.]HVV13445.1 hypothetical protein [Amycolatopsis sp.]